MKTVNIYHPHKKASEYRIGEKYQFIRHNSNVKLVRQKGEDNYPKLEERFINSSTFYFDEGTVIGFIKTDRVYTELEVDFNGKIKYFCTDCTIFDSDPKNLFSKTFDPVLNMLLENQEDGSITIDNPDPRDEGIITKDPGKRGGNGLGVITVDKGSTNQKDGVITVDKSKVNASDSGVITVDK